MRRWAIETSDEGVGIGIQFRHERLEVRAEHAFDADEKDPGRMAGFVGFEIDDQPLQR
jgi:hypothetical protein